jgi:DNA-binding transcriptional MerR regulator
MAQESDIKSNPASEGYPHRKDLEKTLDLWKDVGAELKKLASKPISENFSVRNLVAKLEHLLDSVRAFDASGRAEVDEPGSGGPKITIPDKQYYKIGEVSEILDVEPYVLRYWESEFKILPPTRTRARQRIYHKKHIERLLLIKRLAYDEHFTIAGVKMRLREIDAEAKQTKAGARSGRAREKPAEPEVKTETTLPAQSSIDYGAILLEIRQICSLIREKLEG